MLTAYMILRAVVGTVAAQTTATIDISSTPGIAEPFDTDNVGVEILQQRDSSGNVKSDCDCKVAISAGVITITEGTNANLATGDVFHLLLYLKGTGGGVIQCAATPA